MVRRFSKRRLKHALNSIHKINHANYELIQVRWAGVTSKKYILPYLPNAICPSDEYALYKDNFATCNGELSKVISDIKNAA